MTLAYRFFVRAARFAAFLRFAAGAAAFFFPFVDPFRAGRVAAFRALLAGFAALLRFVLVAFFAFAATFFGFVGFEAEPGLRELGASLRLPPASRRSGASDIALGSTWSSG